MESILGDRSPIFVVHGASVFRYGMPGTNLASASPSRSMPVLCGPKQTAEFLQP